MDTISTITHIIPETCLCFHIVSIHCKWNGTRLLSPEVERVSCSRVAEWLKNKYLGKWENFKEIPKLSADIAKCSVFVPRIKTEENQLLNFP